jgi:rubrerythrin
MRSERRYHRERLKHAREWHWGKHLSGDAKQLGQVVDTPTPCSCPMCGNPRKHFKLKSIQERKSDMAEHVDHD